MDDFAVLLRAQKVGKPPFEYYIGKIRGTYTTDKRQLLKYPHLVVIDVNMAQFSSLPHMIMSDKFKDANAILTYLNPSLLTPKQPEIDVGPIPVFERQTSVCTNQGRQPTCYAHSGAKVILQNIYLFVNPINVQDKEKFHSCFDVLQTDSKHDYMNLSVEKCGIGYFKIILFLYLYFRFKQGKEALGKVYLSDMIRIAVQMPDLDKFEGHIQTNFGALRQRIQHKIESRGLIWNTFIVPRNLNTIPFLKNIVIPILHLGFYINVFIEHPKFPIGHAVVLVNHRNEAGQDYFAISNSWGEKVDITTSNLNEININGLVCSVTYFTFVLPFCTKDTPTTPLPPKPFKSVHTLLEWIPHYVRDIQAFKARSGGKRRKTKKTKK